MARRMLIDASHPEETRVVIVSGNQLEDFDYETSSKQQIKGNIYLAKITRVEPSLQAAFVEYGGNRHGFLAFNEIHPDYYRIPVSDRETLNGAQTAAAEQSESVSQVVAEIASSEIESGAEPGDAIEAIGSADEQDSADYTNGDEPETINRGPGVETMGGDEDEEIDRERSRLRMLRNYRIQEVIKRRQIVLVQVTKEERGNKGAALTTYLSLAGRYCVLMPNTARGGGVSRKISNPADRKRLRVILDDLEIPLGMAVIVRTAGSERSRAEIKRDYEYLMRLWSQIRQSTLESVSPALIHEEGNLIKRSIRDQYSRDIDEVIVDGEESYRTAKDFMRMLMPSHASRVKRYKEEVVSLFQRYSVESQLDEIHSNTVRLKSGGYLVISPTEALVSIDVNSGRATRERHIEETAYKTNMEAAQEVARQLRLRDLAGLIVIDFIDMEEQRNNTAVERKLKDALRGDRARIQIGRISAFGLLEMSRQRLRPSIIEASSQVCPHCNGAGHIRSTESSALQVLRGIEEEGLTRRSSAILVRAPTNIALYLLNQKRAAVTAAEARYSFVVTIATDDSLIAPDFRIERTAERGVDEISELRGADAQARDDATEDVDADDIPAEVVECSDAAGDDSEESKARNRRRRGRRRRPRRDEVEAAAAANVESEAESESSESETRDESDDSGDVAEPGHDAQTDDDEQASPKSRRGRRGGRRRRRRDDDAPVSEPGEGETSIAAGANEASQASDAHADSGRHDRQLPSLPANDAADDIDQGDQPAPTAVEPSDDGAAKHTEPSDTPAANNGHAEETLAEQPVAASGTDGDHSPDQPRRGWWQRLIEG